MIEGIKVTKYFGGLAAVKDVDFDIKEKELVGLIGPNGAGKSTLFNCISGIYCHARGQNVYLLARVSHSSFPFCNDEKVECLLSALVLDI